MTQNERKGRTLLDYAELEANLTLENFEKGGTFRLFAEMSVAVFASTLTGVSPNLQLFMGFHSLVRKSCILATLSALRQHKVQSSANLRQAIEGTVLMVYCLGVPKPPMIEDADNLPDKAMDKMAEAARKWLAANHPDRSDKLKALKADINATDSHANMISAYATFDFRVDGETISENRFFDRDDDDHLRIMLWTVGHTVTHLLATFVEAALEVEGVLIAPDYQERIDHLSKMNDALLIEIQSDPRWASLFTD